MAEQLYPGLNEISIIANTGKRSISRKHLVYVVSDVVPQKVKLKVLHQLPHDTSAFTQGLTFYQGWLYESTGLKGKSRLRKIHPGTGVCVQEQNMDARFFGEGLTVVKDTLHVLTWKDQTHLLYNLGFEELARKDQPLEGWGLCHGKEALWISNGTNVLYQSPVEKMVLNHQIRVMNDNGVVTGINELEWIDGMIYANVYGKDLIVVIEPSTGKVMVEIDAAHLLDRQSYSEAGVLNGIAYDGATKKIYLTGKNWPCIKVCQLHFGE
jgi:glutamine cyclotransferase